MNPTPKPKTIQFTRAALFYQMSSALENIASARGVSRTLCRGDASIQLRHVDELERALKQLRRTLKQVVKREAESAKTEGEVIE